MVEVRHNLEYFSFTESEYSLACRDLTFFANSRTCLALIIIIDKRMKKEKSPSTIEGKFPVNGFETFKDIVSDIYAKSCAFYIFI